MIFRRGVYTLSRQAWLDRPATGLQQFVKRTYSAAGSAGRRIKNALYGTWLGHPFHPVLTDFPIGFWTAAEGFDGLDLATGNPSYAVCADATVAAGFVSALATVAAGTTDWQHTTDGTRRIGLTHFTLNVGTTLAEGVSLLLRLIGARRAGQIVSGVAYGALVVSAYLGSEMVEGERIGVDHTSGMVPPAGFVPVMAEADLAENKLTRVEVNGQGVLLVRRGQEIYALPTTCTHMGGPLPEGQLIDNVVQCPWHASQFALDDGHVVNGPATFPERCLATRVRNGQIEVGPGLGPGRCEHEPVSQVEAQPEAAGALTGF